MLEELSRIRKAGLAEKGVMRKTCLHVMVCVLGSFLRLCSLLSLQSCSKKAVLFSLAAPVTFLFKQFKVPAQNIIHLTTFTNQNAVQLINYIDQSECSPINID